MLEFEGQPLLDRSLVVVVKAEAAVIHRTVKMVTDVTLLNVIWYLVVSWDMSCVFWGFSYTLSFHFSLFITHNRSFTYTQYSWVKKFAHSHPLNHSFHDKNRHTVFFCMFFLFYIHASWLFLFSSLTMFIVAVYCNKIPRQIPCKWKPFWFWFLIGCLSGFIEWLGTFLSSNDVLFEYSSCVSVTIVVAVRHIFHTCLTCVSFVICHFA